MPKTSSNDRINAAFEEIAEVINNPKMREGFLNGNKENEILNQLVEIFEKRRTSHNPNTHVRPRVNPNTKQIPYVPARVNHGDSIPKNRTQEGQQSRIEHVHKRTVTEMSEMSKNEREAALTKLGIGDGETESAEMKIPDPHKHFQK